MSCGARARPRRRIDSVWADLADLAAVGRMADGVRREVLRLRALINNAGIWQAEERFAPCGLEETLVVNAVAPFALVRELRSLLGPSRDTRRS